MLALLEPRPREKSRAAAESSLLAHAVRHTIRRAFNASRRCSKQPANTERSIHTRRDACRKISALVKRMGVQVSFERRRWHWLPAVFPLGVAFTRPVRRPCG